MPLFRISRLSGNTLLGIWKIEEDPEVLLSGLRLNAEEEKYCVAMRSEIRRKQWLSCRRLLAELLPGENTTLVYDAFGKPQLENGKYTISITHSGIYSAVILSRTTPVGIDIEKIKDRIERVKDKFLSKEEIDRIGPDARLEKLYICWGVKETLYKLYGKPEVEFGKDIQTDPFEYNPGGTGELRAMMRTPEGTGKYTLSWERIDDYMLVYCVAPNLTIHERE